MTQNEDNQFWKLWLVNSLATTGIIALSGNCALAQVTPDATLGAESSVVTPNGVINNIPSDQIDGGAIRGVNLFHSFGEFNIESGRGVYFTNPAGIENILSRVTGNNPSKIFGKLGVLGGNANLFLINPNGIIFGSNSSLDVGGSFVSTTANAIQFGNQGFFSASTANLPQVLTVNPSAFLFNQIAANSITNNSTAAAGVYRLRNDNFNIRGLKVPDGKSLLLVGGDVRLDGGGLNALGGRVELGGVAGVGTVGLSVDGNNLHLNFPNDAARADVFLNKRAIVDASGERSGNIEVQGRRVILTEGSRILTRNGGAQPGGSLTVTASDLVELNGSGRTLATGTLGTGAAGDITITTGKLILQNGAQVLTDTDGSGSGGQLNVTASDSVELVGRTQNFTSSGLFSATTSNGAAGNIEINTGRLLIQDGAGISAGSSGSQTLSGSFIPATGQGGNLTINASESLDLINGSILTGTLGIGNAGSINISTSNLIVQGETAQIAVSSEGTGISGNLNVTASSIRLENGGKLLSTSTLGEGGGNITLNNQDLLLLRGNSEISTSAGGSGKGGNIKINTELLVGTENSDITANAFEREGGFIQITSEGIFGLEVREQLTENSDITAFSEKDPSLNGVVEINRPDIDPSADLVVLPAQIIDISGLVAQGCPAGGGNLAKGTGELVVTGRGGLPPTPTEATRSDTTLVDLGTGMPSKENHSRAEMPNNTTSSDSTTLVEAQGWVIGSKGEVILEANPPTVTPQIPWLMPTSCNGS